MNLRSILISEEPIYNPMSPPLFSNFQRSCPRVVRYQSSSYESHYRPLLGESVIFWSCINRKNDTRAQPQRWVNELPLLDQPAPPFPCATPLVSAPPTPLFSINVCFFTCSLCHREVTHEKTASCHFKWTNRMPFWACIYSYFCRSRANNGCMHIQGNVSFVLSCARWQTPGVSPMCCLVHITKSLLISLVRFMFYRFNFFHSACFRTILGRWPPSIALVLSKLLLFLSHAVSMFARQSHLLPWSHNSARTRSLIAGRWSLWYIGAHSSSHNTSTAILCSFVTILVMCLILFRGLW